ncbi:GNAT family N-acetyltransferase [Frigoribacterium salinisoli]
MTTIDPTSTSAPEGTTSDAPYAVHADAEPTTPDLRLEQVPFDDPRAARLRDDMDREMTARYRDPGVDEPAELVAAREAALRLSAEHVVATLLVLDHDDRVLGHAAIRRRGDDWEVKRVVVVDGQRGRGIGRRLMAEVERLAHAAGQPRLVLQTGARQPDAVALYEKIGYVRIPLIPEYAETMPASFMYEKVLDRA